MKRLLLIGTLIIVALLVIHGGANSTVAQGDATAAPTQADAAGAPASPTKSYVGTIPEIEFPTGLDWINVDQPLTLKQLQGKIVLLDFWTYGCINCIHIIPDLDKLQSEFSKDLVIIGVHSAKFKNESLTANIRYIVQRYEINHPVVNDKDFTIWNAYNVEAWPTLVVIDPKGNILGDLEGEGVYNILDPIFKQMVSDGTKQGILNHIPLKTDPILAKNPATDLSFPGKVLASGDSLYISDSDHNRIVVADINTYAVKAVIGNGKEAMTDGDYKTAAFYRPQGLALNGDTLYVADTENHAIRAVDLKAQTVKTIAGLGFEDDDPMNAGGLASIVGLNSPWDVVYVNNALYIAMAGQHQLWKYTPADNRIVPYAGSGEEGIDDGKLRQATLAQPSGITTNGSVLYFTDPESSSVRMASLVPTGTVDTIVGTGLFDFGDVDGTADTVRLQHALGVTLGADGKLYIADTYNSKIKIVDPITRSAKTLFGSTSGMRDGKDPQFYEPGGLSYDNGKLYIADTNNNAIRVADLSSGEVSTVKFPNADVLHAALASATETATESATDSATMDATMSATDVATVAVNATPAKTAEPDVADADYSGKVIQLDPLTATAGQGKIVLNLSVPDGYEFNAMAPFTMHTNQNDLVAVQGANNDLSLDKPVMPMDMPATFSAGSTTLKIDANIYYCESVNETRCYPARMRFVIPLTVNATGSSPDLTINYKVIVPKSESNTLGS